MKIYYKHLLQPLFTKFIIYLSDSMKANIHFYI